MHAGPAGMELAQMLPIMVDDKAIQFRILDEILPAYYEALVAAGPEGLKEEYTFENLKEDWLCGCILW
jgi:hypothetical protein